MKVNQMGNGNSLCSLKVMVKNLSQLEDLFARIRKLQGVLSIERAQAA